MTTKTLTEDQHEKLRESLPDEAVSVHPTKPYLSSIRSIYVTERFNQVFGIGGWTAKAEVIDENAGAPVVYVTFQAPEYGITLSQFGGNDNGGVDAKNYDLGDAYKGAFTDALTKIASYMDVGADVFKGIQTGKGNSKPKPKKQPSKKKQSAPKKKESTPKKKEESVDLSDATTPTDVLTALWDETDDANQVRDRLLKWYKSQDDDTQGEFKEEIMERLQKQPEGLQP